MALAANASHGLTSVDNRACFKSITRIPVGDHARKTQVPELYPGAVRESEDRVCISMLVCHQTKSDGSGRAKISARAAILSCASIDV